MIGLAVTGVLLSVVSLFYYLRVITTMYLQEPKEDAPDADYCPYLVTCALISVFGVSILGIIPSFGINILSQVGF